MCEFCILYVSYPDPGHSVEESAGPVSTSSDTFKYDPDSMFGQYQVSANAGGMFKRFPFQRAFHGTCISTTERMAFTLFIMTHSRRYATPTLCSQASVSDCSLTLRVSNERIQRWSPLQGGIQLPDFNCYPLTEKALLSTRSMLRVRLLRLRIPRKL